MTDSVLAPPRATDCKNSNVVPAFLQALRTDCGVALEMDQDSVVLYIFFRDQF